MDLTFAEPLDTLGDGDGDGGNDSNDEGYDHDAALPINIPPPRPAALQDASLDSSIILQRHYDDVQAQQDMQAKLWVFPETDVEIDCDKPSGREMSGKFLGEGTFGKVYVAKWRHVDIACKRLHLANNNSAQTINVRGYQGDHIGEMVASIKAQRERALQTKVHLRELEVLTKLRHPNLVLFLGICHAAHDRMEPTMMLSELMNYSLHDLIEVQRVCLDVPEMLEILLDITKGLAFLHSQDPCVIHANLTSKNILFKGYSAKISDFGVSGIGLASQFKPVVWTNSAGKTVVGSVMKGQDEAPQQFARAGRTPPRTSEAVAFLAPEVLDGTKYDLLDRVDIYSLGVVLLHMVHGKHPELETRVQSCEEVEAKQPAFRNLIKALLQDVPTERPGAKGVIAFIEEIMFNDRYYPLSRARPAAQSEVSIVARRWMQDEAKNENKLAIKRLRQMTDLLKAEGTRWQKEGSLGKYLQDQLEDANKKLLETTEKYVAQSEVLATTQERLQRTEFDLRSYVQITDKKNSQLLVEKHHLSERLMDLDMRHRQCVQDLRDSDAALRDVSQHLATRDNSIINLKAKERADATERRHLNEQIESLTEEVADLEDRLEQTLERWKKETEVSATCRADFVKLRQTCTTLLQKNERLEGEKAVLAQLVKEQEAKVLPEEVMFKITKLEADVVQAALAGEALMEQKLALESQLADMTASRDEYSAQLEEAQLSIKEKKSTIAERDRTIADMREAAAATEVETNAMMDSLNEKEAVSQMRITKLEEWVKSLEKGILPQGRQVVAVAAADASKPSGMIENEESKGGGGGSGADAYDSMGGDDLSQYSEGTQGPKAFHMADLAISAKHTEERKAVLRAQNADKMEKAKAAAIRAADSMAKARVKAFEQAESGTGVLGTGCYGLVNMLRDSVHDEHICWRACRSLRPIILNDKSEQQQLRSICVSNELDLICVQIMKHHSGSTAMDSLVQGQAVQLLGVVAFGSDLVRRRAGEAGALALITLAMETHGVLDEKVLLHCLTSVTNLTHNSQDNRHRFIDAGGVDVLTDVMEASLTNPKVQRQGCWALLTLAGSDETARLVASGGGSRTLMTLVKALLQHPFDAGVQQFGLWAMSNMALAGADIGRRLKKAGAPEICRIAVENHPQDPEVIRQARHAAGVLGNASAPAAASQAKSKKQ